MAYLTVPLTVMFLLNCLPFALSGGHDQRVFFEPTRHMPGNNHTLALSPLLERDLFGRQSCGKWGRCSGDGECCPDTGEWSCCGRKCVPKERSCCGQGTCPEGWDCCLSSKIDCYPLNGADCCSDGTYCRAGSYCIKYNNDPNDIRCEKIGQLKSDPAFSYSTPPTATVDLSTTIPVKAATTDPSSIPSPTVTEAASVSSSNPAGATSFEYYTATVTIYFYTYFYTTIFRTSTELTSSTITSEIVVSAEGSDYAEASSSMYNEALSLQAAASSSAWSERPPPITAGSSTSSTRIGIEIGAETGISDSTASGVDGGPSSKSSKVGMMSIHFLFWTTGIALAAI